MGGIRTVHNFDSRFGWVCNQSKGNLPSSKTTSVPTNEVRNNFHAPKTQSALNIQYTPRLEWTRNVNVRCICGSDHIWFWVVRGLFQRPSRVCRCRRFFEANFEQDIFYTIANGSWSTFKREALMGTLNPCLFQALMGTLNSCRLVRVLFQQLLISWNKKKMPRLCMTTAQKEVLVVFSFLNRVAYWL